MGLVVGVGVDLGQRHDPTALVVAEAIPAGGPRAPEHRFVVRELGRLPLGTGYPQVYAAIAAVLRGVRAHGCERPHLCVDATGAVPAVDALRHVLRDLPCRLTAVTFTYGDRFVRDVQGVGTASLGKAYLVSRLQVLFQTDRIDLPPSKAEAAAMVRELQDYEIRVDPNANEQYGAFSTGAHDDLVTALGLATLEPPAPPSATYLGADDRAGGFWQRRGW